MSQMLTNNAFLINLVGINITLGRSTFLIFSILIIFLFADVLCAAAAGRGMCMGDSGAPVAIDNALVGCSSFYRDCLTDEFPDVFTRIDRYTNWILEVATPRAARQAGVVNAPRVRSM